MKCWIAAMSYGVENDLMSVPQFIWIACCILQLALHGLHHGKPLNAQYDFYAACVCVAVEIGLLGWGGFFR